MDGIIKKYLFHCFREIVIVWTARALSWTRWDRPWFYAWGNNAGEYFVTVGIVENGISTMNGLDLTDCVIDRFLNATEPAFQSFISVWSFYKIVIFDLMSYDNWIFRTLINSWVHKGGVYQCIPKKTSKIISNTMPMKTASMLWDNTPVWVFLKRWQNDVYWLAIK